MIQVHFVSCAYYLYYDYIRSPSDHQALDIRVWRPPALEAKERRDTFDSFSHIVFVFAYFLKGSHSYICRSDSTHGLAFFQFVFVGRAASAWPRAGAASLTTLLFPAPAPLGIQKSTQKRAQG